jgi:hypothetical protein
MAETIIKLKRGTEEALQRVNPVLAAGEPIVSFLSDGKIQLKIGDGKKHYADLEVSTQVPDNVSVVFEDGRIGLSGFKLAEDYSIPFKASNDTMDWVSLDFISSNTVLKYNAVSGELQLCNGTGSVMSVVDAADFAVVGLLEDVYYDQTDNSIEFIWNTANGQKTSAIPLNSQLTPYQAGYGIEVIDETISIKHSVDSERFLYVDASGVGIRGIKDAMDTLVDPIKIDVAALNEAHTLMSRQLDLIGVEISDIASNIDDISTDINDVRFDIETSINAGLEQIQDELDILADSVKTLENIDVQGMIDTSLESYVKDSDIDTTISEVVNEAIDEAIKDLDININLDTIDAGRITDVPINQS